MSSTQVVALVSTSTSASITLISVWFIVWSRGVRCSYCDHKEKKQKVCFVTHSFLDKVWNYPKVFKVSVWTIVITNGLIKFCKKIKESTSYAKCRSLFERDMGIYGIAVLGFFSCGISVVLILRCGIAVSSSSAVCGFSSFWLTVFGDWIILFTVLRYRLFALSSRNNTRKKTQ